MEKFKEHVDSGKLEFAKLNEKNEAQKVSYEQVLEKTNRQNEFARVFKSLESLDWDEKYEWTNIRRLKGNEFYKMKKYDQAIDCYLTSLLGVDLNDNTQGRLQIMKEELKYPITLNIVSCFYQKKQYEKGIKLCERILKEDQNFVPAVYKKSFLLIRIGEYEEAKEHIERGIELTKESKNSLLLTDFLNLQKDLKESTKKNKKVYEKIFNPQKDENDPLLEKEEQILYYKDPEEPSLFQRFQNMITDCMRPRSKASKSKKSQKSQ